MRNGTLALVVLALSTATASAQGWAEKMFEKKLTHDFGTVPRGAQLVHRFTITNIYAVPMEITQVKSGCGCVSATAAKPVLGPRESTTVEVRMDSKRFTGPKTVGVRVTVGPRFVSSAELRVTANSRADVVFNPGEVAFGTVGRGLTPTQTIDVEYAGPLAWEVKGVEVGEAPYTATAKEMYRRRGQVGYRLTVTMKANAPVGALKHDVFLKTNDPTAALVPLLVEANVEAALTVVPSSIALGTIKLKTPLVRRIVLRGARPFRVLGVEGTGAGITLSAPPSATDSIVQTVLIKIEATTAGDVKRTLKIKTSLQDAPVLVPIEGTAR